MTASCNDEVMCDAVVGSRVPNVSPPSLVPKGLPARGSASHQSAIQIFVVRATVGWRFNRYGKQVQDKILVVGIADRGITHLHILGCTRAESIEREQTDGDAD